MKRTHEMGKSVILTRLGGFVNSARRFAGRCRVSAKRVFGVLLAVMLICDVIPPFEAKADGGTAVSDMYILEITTGESSVDEVDFFEISYTGTDNKNHKHYIFPNADDLAIGRKEAAEYGYDKDILDDISEWYGYTMDTDLFKTGKGSGLASKSFDQYCFRTDVGIKQVTRIEGFMSKAGVWTCLGFRLFRVDKIGGLRMMGYWSDRWYIDFEGEMIAELTASINNWGDNNNSWLNLPKLATLKTSFSGDERAVRKLQTETSAYGFRIDLADVYGAGFESLAAEYDDGKHDLTGSDSDTIPELITFTVTYTDIFGAVQFLRLPVMTSVAGWSYSNGATGEVAGIAQQGDTICFVGDIPFCASIDSITATFGTDKAVAEAGIKDTGDGTGRFVRRQNRSQKALTDDIRITCMAVYDMNNASIVPYVDGAQLKYNISGNPIMYRTSADVSGEAIYATATQSLNLKQYDGRSLAIPDNNEYYLVQFVTDDINSASTTADLFVTLNYINSNGIAVKTGEIDLKEAVRQYYGYWPGDTEDFLYKWGITKGNTISMLVKLSNVDSFTGMNIRMKGQDGSDLFDDDYQFKNLVINKLSYLGKRKVVWKDMSMNGMNSRIEITREYEGKSSKISILDIKESVLVQPGETYNFDFKSVSIDSIVENSWDNSTYSMTFEEAMQNFDFPKKRKTYEVTVNVFDDTVGTDDEGNVVASGGNGDAGSENLFYFQLIFENGSSCYELANQQILGDRFISGRASSFYISTNQDYGEVTAIRIIPDDSSQDSKKFDKLRIDSIEVIEVGLAGTHTCWIANDVGWIGVGYTAEQELNGMGGRKGRTAAEMAKTVPISYATNVVQLEVAIHTNNSTQSEGYAKQLKAKVSGKFTTVNFNGERKPQTSFDVVQHIYTFMNKNSKSVTGGTVSDPTYMFRENHTDRFFVDVKDVKELVSLSLDITSIDKPYLWNIGGVSVRLVTETGRLKLNAFDEYEYQRNAEQELLCIQKDDEPYKWLCEADTSMKYEIDFTENAINLGGDYGTVISKIAREPASKNDELNVFLFPTQGLGESINNYDLDISLYYAHAYGLIYETGGRMKKYTPTDSEPGQPVFYLTGLNAEGMIDLNRIKVAADVIGVRQCYVSHAIVQQVRDGVVVANYFVDLQDKNAAYAMTVYPSTSMERIGYQDYQVMSIQIGEMGTVKNLFAERQDMAVAFTYKLSNDPTKGEYRTPYIYLTDQNVLRLRSGQIVDITFGQMFAGEITGIVAACTGDVETYINMASVATYQMDAGGTVTRTGHYSFGNGAIVTNVPARLRQTDNKLSGESAVRDVTITFKTSAASNLYESGTHDPVRMDLYVVDPLGYVGLPITIDDITKYLTDDTGYFETDKTQTIRFMVKGAAALRRIELEPISRTGDGNGGWSLDQITAKLGNEPAITRVVGGRIYEGSMKTVTLSNVTVSAKIYNANESDVFSMQEVTMEETLELVALAEKDFFVETKILGSERGVDVSVVEVVDGKYLSGRIQDNFGNDGNDMYYFMPPLTPKKKVYRITVASNEVPESKVQIDLVVLGIEDLKAAEEEAQKNEETENGDGAGEPGAGTGENTGEGIGEPGAGTGENTGEGTGEPGAETGENTGEGTGEPGAETGENTGEGTGEPEAGTGENTGEGTGEPEAGTGENTGEGTGEPEVGTGENTGEGTGEPGAETGDNTGESTGDTGADTGDTGTDTGSGSEGTGDAGDGE